MATPKKSSGKKRSTGAKKAGGKSGFPSGRVGTMLRKGRFSRRVSKSAGHYLAAVLGYLTQELLELSAKTLKKRTRLTPRAVAAAARGDDELGTLLNNVTLSRGGVAVGVNPALERKKKAKAGKSGKKAAKKGKKAKKSKK